MDGPTHAVTMSRSEPVPVLATFLTVRRGRDPFFKFFMKSLFPKQVDRYQKSSGCGPGRYTSRTGGISTT